MAETKTDANESRDMGPGKASRSFHHGEIPVRITYAQGGKTLEEALIRYFRALQE